MTSIINIYELSCYFVFWSGINVYALYKNFDEQNYILAKNPYLLDYLRDIGPGWSFMSRQKDVSDVEWTCWKFYLRTSWAYMLFQFAVSEILRRSYPTILKYWYILSSMIFIAIFMGVKQLIIVVAQPILFAAIIFMGGKKISIWMTSIMILSSYNLLKYNYYFWIFLDSENLQDEEVYLLLFAIAWIELRCISFCIDYIDKQEKLKSKGEKDPKAFFQNVVNMFSYVLYLPLLYIGPIMLYEDFENSFHVNKIDLFPRLIRFFVDMTLFTIYSFLMDLAFHYMYFYALQERMEFISEMSSLAICGGGLWMGFQFHLKYVITYGTTAAFARLDHMEPPPTPRCIARIHVYSQMWRYFDVGLYKFLVKYIYRPGYGMLSQYFTMSKIIYKQISALSTFLFIFMWHGIVWNIFMWSTLNYFGIIIEYSAKAIATTNFYKQFKEKVLRTDANEIRFEALLCSPLLAISCISNFYLFGGSKVGDLYFFLLKWPAPYNLMIVLLAVYCCSHVSIALKNVPSRTDVKNFKS